MKKQLAYCFLLLLVLMSVCYAACGESCSHSINCNEPTICIWCGETLEADVTPEIYHTGYGYVSYGDQHRYECLGCGDSDFEMEPHWAYCDTPSTCMDCETAGLTINPEHIYHAGEAGYVDLGECHQYQCLDCGAGLEAEENHLSYCNTPDECMRCGAAGVTVAEEDVYHIGEWDFVDVGGQHQYQCVGCGKSDYDPEDHLVDCQYPNECKYCGAAVENAAAEQITHLSCDWGFVDLGNQHQYQCLGCGTALREAVDHYVRCDEPGTCYDCQKTGLKVDADAMKHVGTKKLVDIGDSHQQECSECKAKLGEPEKHWAMCDAPNHCNKCGLDNVMIDDEYLYHDGTKYINDGVNHKKVCVSCEYVFDTGSSHQGYCSRPDYCIVCDLDGVTISKENLEHNYFDKLVCLGGQHQHQCACGLEKTEPEECEASCSAPLECASCGGKVEQASGDKQIHYNNTYEAKGDSCREVCFDCGYVGEYYRHAAPCDYALRCIMCDTPVDQYTYHSHIYYEITEDKHKLKCYCGYTEPAESHYAICTEPGVCAVCGKEGMTDDPKHTGEFIDMGDTHHFECEGCSYVLDEQHWVICTDQSACYYCGKTGFEVTWKNRYCFDVEHISYTSQDHTYYCPNCKKTYTEPHHDIKVGEECSCGYVKKAEDKHHGDANGDNMVNLDDAIAILSNKVENEANADVNGDGKVDEKDVLLIMQYEAGWDVPLK